MTWKDFEYNLKGSFARLRDDQGRKKIIIIKNLLSHRFSRHLRCTLGAQYDPTTLSNLCHLLGRFRSNPLARIGSNELGVFYKNIHC